MVAYTVFKSSMTLVITFTCSSPLVTVQARRVGLRALAKNQIHDSQDPSSFVVLQIGSDTTQEKEEFLEMANELNQHLTEVGRLETLSKSK